MLSSHLLPCSVPGPIIYAQQHQERDPDHHRQHEYRRRSPESEILGYGGPCASGFNPISLPASTQL